MTCKYLVITYHKFRFDPGIGPHTDIDECTLGLNNCDDNATCTDTEGSFFCTCNVGYTGDGVNCTSRL